MNLHNYEGVEVIIIDDNSEQKHLVLLDSGLYQISTNYKIIKNTKNRGPSYCRNIGLAKSKGEFVVFLDSDDRINPDLIFNKINKTNEDVIVNYNAVDWSNTSIVYDKISLNSLKHRWSSSSSNYNLPHTSCMVLRKSFLVRNKIKFPQNTRKGEDTVFKFLIMANNPRVTHVFEGGTFFIWNNQDTSLTRIRDRKDQVKLYLEEIKSGVYLMLYTFKYNNIGFVVPLRRILNSSKKYLKYKLAIVKRW